MPESETDRKDPTTVTASVETPQPALHGERADLLVELATARATLTGAVRGLTDAQLGERPTASALCLGGLVKHVANTEATWVRFLQHDPTAMDYALPEGVTWDEIVTGTAREYPSWILARQEEFAMAPDDTAEAILTEYARVAGRTTALVTDLPDLAATYDVPAAPWGEPQKVLSARRVLLHVIAETAQHAGHADIIREQLDGHTAM